MGLHDILYAQFRQPTGALGSLAGWIMANRPSNLARNRWTVALLDLQPDHDVLEIGCGPGRALELTARIVSRGRIAGLDHSQAMLRQARARNAAACRAGRIELTHGGLERLAGLGLFDRIFAVNVLMFCRERRAAIATMRQALKPGGRLAVTYQPRHRRATASDAHAASEQLSRDLESCGFDNVRVKTLLALRMPAVCIMGEAPRRA